MLNCYVPPESRYINVKLFLYHLRQNNYGMSSGRKLETANALHARQIWMFTKKHLQHTKSLKNSREPPSLYLPKPEQQKFTYGSAFAILAVTNFIKI